MDLIGRSIGPRIKVSLDADSDLIVKLDPGQFELAVLNLAVNARDAMPDGGSIQIRATGSRADERNPEGLPAGDYVVVSVIDSGSGMSPATLKRAIEPFFSTKGQGKGTGLGLSMVHGLAAQSNGALRLLSKPGEGTTAELWFPASQDRLEASEELKSEVERPSGQGTVLLVDDEDLVRRATAEMLRDCGYEVVEASDGSEALQKLKGAAVINMLVTDYLMPGMTGAALVREAQAIAPDLPALIITGYAVPEDLPSNLPRLRKPFRQEELAHTVAEVSKAHGSNVVDIAFARKA
jgi:CheY-like chemotaxis protein